MTKKVLWVALIMAVGFLAVDDAHAGWFDKKKDGGEEGRAKSHRYDFLPSMGFHQGTLRRDNFGGWTLEETSLHIMSGAKITEEGMESFLSEGRKAIVMGPRVGDTIVAWRVRILESDWNISRDTSRDHAITWSEEDRTVGESMDPGPQ
jgi:hypothetical protein|nr:hypothetical protein [Candidatus Krumholzibacteria bacterium]